MKRMLLVSTLAALSMQSAADAQVMVHNETYHGGKPVFSAKDPLSPTPWRKIRMGDPTILQLVHPTTQEVTFYVTGTSDDFKTMDFPIFKSKDLLNWTYIGSAFGTSPFTPFPTPASLPSQTLINGRSFSGFWSPQLYIDPNEATSPGQNVYLSFAGSERMYTNSTIPYEQRRSVYLASIPKEHFEAGGFGPGTSRRFSAGPGRTDEPLRYVYHEFNHGGYPERRDGGHYLNTQDPELNAVIPVTGDESLEGTAFGQATHHESGWTFNYTAPVATSPNGRQYNSWLSDAPFVFYDPAEITEGRQSGWMVYNSHSIRPPTSQIEWQGNSVWAYPFMSTQYLRVNNHWMDVYRTSSMMELFYCYNNSDPSAISPYPFIDNYPWNPTAWVPLGAITYPTTPYWWRPTYEDRSYFAGVAEGASALYYEDQFVSRYYVFTNRNPWNGRGYMITYRSSQSDSWDGAFTFASMGVEAGIHQDVTEEVLLAGNFICDYTLIDRDANSRRNFGGGEVFFNQKNDRYYLICHINLEALAGGPTTPLTDERHVYFKELSFRPNSASFYRLFDYDPNPFYDVNYFLVP